MLLRFSLEMLTLIYEEPTHIHLSEKKRFDGFTFPEGVQMEQNGNDNGMRNEKKKREKRDGADVTLEKVEERIRALYARYRAGDMSESEYFGKLSRLDDLLQKLEKKEGDQE